jgi:hypothetical protein
MSNVSRVVVALVVSLAGGWAHAATVLPISVTGYNQDIIFENDGSPAATTTYGSRFFFENGLIRVGGTSPGTPADGGLNSTGLYTAVADSSVQFQLGSYAANNVLLVNRPGSGTNTGTLTFAPGDQGSYSRIAIAASSGGAGSLEQSGQFTINFVGGGTQTGQFNAEDWGLSHQPIAMGGFDRAANPGGNAWSHDENSVAFKMFLTVVDILPANQSLTIQSVTFGWSSTNAGTLGVFAVSGEPTAIPEPAMLGLLTMAVAGFLRRR